MSRLAASCVVASLLLAGRAHATEVSGSAALTSDYVWRGTSQSRGEPALQGGFKVAGASGAYASLWASNVEFSPDAGARSEVDATVGWSAPLSSNWSIDANLLRYLYPSTHAGLDWTELNGTLAFRDRGWLALGYSAQALGGDDSGLYAQIGGRVPLNARVHIEGAVARYFVHARSYNHAQLSAVLALAGPVSLRLTAHSTDSNARRVFGNDAAGTRFEAALQAAF